MLFDDQSLAYNKGTSGPPPPPARDAAARPHDPAPPPADSAPPPAPPRAADHEASTAAARAHQAAHYREAWRQQVAGVFASSHGWGALDEREREGLRAVLRVLAGEHDALLTAGGGGWLDAMVASERLQVAIVPTWDRTGILTLLGALPWWSEAAAVAVAQDRPA